MQPKAILFDLDGTLTDSGEGIIKCASLALEHFGLPVPSREQMRVVVGPPLHDSFIRFGVKPEDADEAIRVYRSRYNTVGKYENFPYPGIEKLLQDLKAQGCHLFVATSKPESMSKDILDHFALSEYFEIICGATMDSSRSTKDKVIAYLLEQIGTQENCIMVGDTEYDVLGAAAHGIKTIGVAWGYGTVESMEKAGAAAIAHTMDELFTLLTQ